MSSLYSNGLLVGNRSRKGSGVLRLRLRLIFFFFYLICLAIWIFLRVFFLGWGGVLGG